MARRRKSRDELVGDVVKAWNSLPSHGVKPDLMTLAPDLYFAVAWLAAHETVRGRG